VTTFIAACGRCGFIPPGPAAFCPNCGTQRPPQAPMSGQTTRPPTVQAPRGFSASTQQTSGQPSAARPVPQPIKPAGSIPARTVPDRVSNSERLATTGDRLAKTGGIMMVSGCMLALLFWVVLPLGIFLIALAATSTEGALAVGIAALLVGGFFWLVFRSTRAK